MEAQSNWLLRLICLVGSRESEKNEENEIKHSETILHNGRLSKWRVLVSLINP